MNDQLSIPIPLALLRSDLRPVTIRAWLAIAEQGEYQDGIYTLTAYWHEMMQHARVSTSTARIAIADLAIVGWGDWEMALSSGRSKTTFRAFTKQQIDKRKLPVAEQQLELPGYERARGWG